MQSRPPKDEDGGRLHRCIRDLVALNALPSMCIGRSPDDTLEIVLDALPTALGCELVYLTLPSTPRIERATLRGAPLPEQMFEALRHANLDVTPPVKVAVEGLEDFWCIEADLQVGRGVGRLVVGRTTPLDPETDRVLVRSAANLVGTTLEMARILEEARRKDEFLAVLGHELRNPLAPILTAVELLSRNDSVQREREVIGRHTRHLSRLVDDLLDISRVTRGHVELRDEQVSLTTILEGAVEVSSTLLKKHRHSVQIASCQGVTLRGDAVRLAQIFGNLLTNAAKFTPSGGRIEVGVETLPARVRVSVRDNGRGIEPHQLRSIFEPFVQADREQDALRGGLGLGLAIVANLVDRHGGTISVESPGAGRGAIFSVELPTVAAVEKIAEPLPPQPAAARGEKRVLVVDDDVDLAEMLSVALDREGFRTAVAHNAHAALEAWRKFQPHAGVLDVGLPEMDGYELAKALRAEHGHDVTLIAATGYGQRTDRLRAADAGFDCHFVKPVSVHDLAQALDARVVRSS